MTEFIVNYFQVLELKNIKFDIAESTILKQYLKLQKQYNPIQDPDNLNRASLVNEAYINLSDQFLRAKHIFNLANISPESIPMSPRIFDLMAEPEINLRDFTKKMEQAFKEEDIYQACEYWSICQYLRKTLGQGPYN